MKNLYLFVLLLFSSLLSFSQIESGAIDITFECLNGGDTTLFDNWVASNGGAIASTDCGAVTWSYVASEFNGFCSDIVTVTYTATNDCGTEQTIGTVFFQDTLSPFLGEQADDRSVVCDGSGNTTELNAWLATNGGAFAFDECSDVTWSNDFTDLNTDCSETVSVEVEFTASDDCGNQSTTLATFFIEPVNSSCPEGPITLNSQAEVDAFALDYPNCTALTNILSISGADITNLSGLSNLEIVGGIEIINNPLLVNLDGLENLTTLIDGFTVFSISDNASLESISGLGGITGSLSHIINIRNNPVLQSLTGLEGITSTEDTCRIVNNDSLTDLTGLTNFEGCDDLFIEDNDLLESINGLATSFTTGRFYFINNDAIVSLQNQSSINPQCGIVIRDNDLLEDIDGFAGIYNFECELEIRIINNQNLSTCSTPYTCNYISNLDLAFGTIDVRDNAPGCNSVFEISSGCDQEPFNDECEGGELEELVIGQSYNVSFDLATQSSYIPTCNDSEDRADVWFTFNTGSFTSLTLAVGPGNAFQLWEGNCDDLIAISELCGSNQISFDTPANKQYYLQLWANTDPDRSIDLTGDFEIIVQDATLALSDFDLDDFKLFPNPFENQLTLSYTKTIETIYIYDIQGKLVEVIEINTMNAMLNLSEYESGMYFLKLVNEDFSATRKIIKQ